MYIAHLSLLIGQCNVPIDCQLGGWMTLRCVFLSVYWYLIESGRLGQNLIHAQTIRYDTLLLLPLIHPTRPGLLLSSLPEPSHPRSLERKLICWWPACFLANRLCSTHLHHTSLPILQTVITKRNLHIWGGGSHEWEENESLCIIFEGGVDPYTLSICFHNERWLIKCIKTFYSRDW